MPDSLTLHLGVKTDPVQYRYSYEWLFRLMAEEGIRHAQLGSFFELYQLPDDWFVDLRRLAASFGVRVSGVFTTHRELGGFFRDEPGWRDAAMRSFRRMIEIAALLGADAAGSNPGSVLRDRMGDKAAGIQRYMDAMRELLMYARRLGVPFVTAEPMSALAEPPTMPDEIQTMGEELRAYVAAHPGQTANFGYCVDVAHGYADADRRVQWSHLQLFEATFPWLQCVHLKNTDSHYDATFGFSEAERARGIIDIPTVRDLLLRNVHRLTTREIVGYLEIGGPKLGRDYSDPRLEASLRASLRYLRETWPIAVPLPETEKT
ncbi:MAG: sugar phosphate isomerase/epimerase [Anaerolineae bacterium]|jgi:ribulose-phosphate 3-epimerase|nr:sugar phosphate isomerase/epimerase [Anaerolineae bacterium]